VDSGATLGVRLGLPQHFVCDRSGVTLPEKEEAKEVYDGVALRPPEVAVRGLATSVAEMEQEGGDGVGHHRALGAQHLVVADLDALHLQHIRKFGGVIHVDLKEEDRLAGRDVVILALLPLL
jgi:hypothetical protein